MEDDSANALRGLGMEADKFPTRVAKKRVLCHNASLPQSKTTQQAEGTMGGFRTGNWRRVAGAFGLLGVLVYSSLIPGHLVSQTLTVLVQAELGVVVPICHRGGAGSPAGKTTKDQSCPFCHGYASFMAAVPSIAVALLVPPRVAERVAPVQDNFRVRRATLTPQSRGPPQLSI